MEASVISMNQSHLVITGGQFKQEITHTHHTKGLIELLQEQVAPAAFHNSAQRIDAPRCHPDTRIRVKHKSSRWAQRLDPLTSDMSIMWLSGSAGAGKSAIAQSLAEQFSSQNLLLASFFFSRSDSSRNHVGQLVATLVYQISQVLPQSAQAAILQAIDRDRLIWSRNIFTQFEILIMRPLRGLIESGFFQDMTAPRVIIIDGLDECIDIKMQKMVLNLLFKAAEDWHLPFLFLVASRPESDIRLAFIPFSRQSIHFSINLDVERDALEDIETFIRNELTKCRDSHPLQQYIPSTWPPETAIEALVQKSNGQFIHATVVAQYVTSTRHHPLRRLESALSLRPTKDTFYAELDALYSQVLASVEDVDLLRRILTIRLLFNTFSVRDIDVLLGLDEGETMNALCDVGALISIIHGPETFNSSNTLDHTHLDLSLRYLCRGSDMLRISHASLLDYLFDSSRSGAYHTDKASGYYEYTQRFITLLNTTELERHHLPLMVKICAALPQCFRHINIDDRIHDTIVSDLCIASIFRKFQDLAASETTLVWRGKQRETYGRLLFRILVVQSLPSILVSLRSSTSIHAQSVCQHLVRGIRDILSQYYNSETKTTQLDFNLALLSLGSTKRFIPPGVFNSVLCIESQPTSFQDRLDRCKHMFSKTLLDDGYLALLFDWLASFSDGTTPVSDQVFANAAVYCIDYLYTLGQRRRTPLRRPFPRRLQKMRRACPWKWRQRPTHQVLGDVNTTPWMWLSKWHDLHPVPLHTSKYRLKPYYAALPPSTELFSRCRGTLERAMGPNIQCMWDRIDSEKYWLALHYLTLFLPRAGPLPMLVEMCESGVFASRSQEFGEKSRKARTAMREYLTRLHGTE